MYPLTASSLAPLTAALHAGDDMMMSDAVRDSLAIAEGEDAYADAVKLAAGLCETPAAVLSFVDRDRQTFRAEIGIDPHEAQRALAFCAEAMRSPDAVTIIPDALQDARFACTGANAGDTPLRFFAGAPILLPRGTMLGTISVLDRISRQLTPAQTKALQLLARQIGRQNELERTNAAFRRANARLAEISVTDALTCIPNRRAFNHRLYEEEARSKRTGDPLSLLLIDVDQFKSFNDRFGHVAGDTALFRIAEILKTHNRPYDFVARYGGEEFAVILSQTALQAAIGVAERLRASVEATEMLFERLTLSIGVAMYDPEQGTAALISAADRALYAAKAGGRNRVAVDGEPPAPP